MTLPNFQIQASSFFVGQATKGPSGHFGIQDLSSVEDRKCFECFMEQCFADGCHKGRNKRSATLVVCFKNGEACDPKRKSENLAFVGDVVSDCKESGEYRIAECLIDKSKLEDMDGNQISDADFSRRLSCRHIHLTGDGSKSKAFSCCGETFEESLRINELNLKGRTRDLVLHYIWACNEDGGDVLFLLSFSTHQKESWSYINKLYDKEFEEK